MDYDRNLIWEAYTDKQGKKPYSPIGPDPRPKEGTPEGEEYETRHITPGPERERELKRRKEARENKPKEEGAFGGPGGNPDYDDIGQGQETYDEDPLVVAQADDILSDAIEQHEADRGLAYQMFDDEDWDEVFNLTAEAGPNDDQYHQAIAELIKDKMQHDIQDEPPENLHIGGHHTDSDLPPVANEKPPFDSMGERGHAN
tara:strand:+ start:74 stop:676 length:603 start_codon:yes stop_codon:yes gene_type:complete